MTLRGFTSIPGKYFRTIIQLNLYSLIKYKINIFSKPSDCDGNCFTSFFSGSVCHAFHLRTSLRVDRHLVTDPLFILLLYHFNELFERIRVPTVHPAFAVSYSYKRQLNTSLRSSHHSFKGIQRWALLCNGRTCFHIALCILANLFISCISTATVWSLFSWRSFWEASYTGIYLYMYIVI